MKKSIWTVLLSALVALLAVGCAKEADLSDLKNKVSDLDKRVTALEDAIDEINKETIPGLKNLVDAVNNKITIQSVVEGDGEYTINFTDGTSAVIKNGNDGEDGDDAEAPVISITLGEDGIYYWTVNGQLMKDEAGNPLPVTAKGDKGDKGETGDKGEDGDKGDKGEDGITPLFGTSSEGKVIVSYDNGETWKPLGFSVIDGSAFTSAYIDDSKSTEDYIVLVVGETEVQIPKEKTFSLKISYEGDLSSVGANAGETIALEYTVQGVSSTDEVTVDILSATAGITAKLVKIDAVSGYIMIAVPAADPEATEPAKIEGKVFVFADNNKGKSNIKVISLEKGEISAVADVSAQAPAAGGEFELTVTTNKEYNVNIDDEASSWLSVVETKATHTDKLKIVAAKNETGAYRVGTVTINDRNTADKIEEFTVVQQPSDAVPTDIASVRGLADGTEVAVKGGVVVAASKEGVIVADENGGYLYVYVGLNPAIDRGDVIDFTGVKKTNEQTALKYVDATSGTVAEQDPYEGEIPDLGFTGMRGYYGYDSIFSGVTGVLTKGESGYGLDVSNYAEYYPNFIFETPVGVDLEPFVGKMVTVKGYTNGSYVDYDENDYFTEDSFVNFIVNSVSEVTFEANPNWTLSYEGEQNGKSVIKNTVADGSEDYYFSYQAVYVSKANIEKYGLSLDEFIVGQCLSTAEMVQYWFGELNETIDDDATVETKSFNISNLAYGTYYALAVGLNEDGFVSGKYAVLEFEKVDPHVAAEYTDFIGTWNVGTSTWTISQNVEGESYIVKGVMGTAYDFEYAGVFVDGKFAFMEKDFGSVVDGYEHVTMGGQFYSSTYGTQWGLNHNLEEPSVIFTVAKLNDGTFDVTPGEIFGFAYNYISLWGMKGGSPSEIAYKKMPTTFVVSGGEPAGPVNHTDWNVEYQPNTDTGDEEYPDAVVVTACTAPYFTVSIFNNGVVTDANIEDVLDYIASDYEGYIQAGYSIDVLVAYGAVGNSVPFLTSWKDLAGSGPLDVVVCGIDGTTGSATGHYCYKSIDFGSNGGTTSITPSSTGVKWTSSNSKLSLEPGAKVAAPAVDKKLVGKNPFKIR